MRINEKRATGAIELTVSLYLYTLTAAPRFFFLLIFLGSQLSQLLCANHD